MEIALAYQVIFVKQLGVFHVSMSQLRAYQVVLSLAKGGQLVFKAEGLVLGVAEELAWVLLAGSSEDEELCDFSVCLSGNKAPG